MAQKKITDLTLRSSFDETVNLPGDDTSQTWRVTGQQILDFLTSKKNQSYEIENLSLASSVSGNALTIAVKTKAGTNASSTDVVAVGMRSSTLTSGVYNRRTLTAALSVVLSSGSTLGQVDGQPSRIYVYLIDNAGTLELAVSHKRFSEGDLVSTTAEGGAGAADSATVMYSTTARSSVPCRLVGYIDNTQTTAGTWASAGTQIQLVAQPSPWKAPTMQTLTASSGTYIKPVGAKYLRVRMIGGGGGGGGAGSGTTAGSGSAGGASTFGSSLLTANGGSGGVNGAGSGGAGGSATISSPAYGTALTGSSGGTGCQQAATGGFVPGGQGATTPFGGGAIGGLNSAGSNAVANTGGGGGGGGPVSPGSSLNAGGGGGAGGLIDAIIPDPLASYAYACGALGAKGTVGTTGATGGDGGTGYIEVTEYYQ